jgi:hypothetical protein
MQLDQLKFNALEVLGPVTVDTCRGGSHGWRSARGVVTQAISPDGST